MQAFTNILIKVLAIYLISNAITSIGSVTIFQFQMDSEAPLPWASIIGYLIIPIIVGAIIWFSSNKLSKKVHNQELSITETELVSAGTFLIGLFLFSQSIGIVIGNYIQLSEIVWSRLIILVISLLLIGSPKTLTHIYKKVKYLGS